MKEVFDFDFYGRKLSVETGEVAKQAGGSVLVRYGDTVTLSTACASSVAKDTDFFPLTVSFEEKLYSVGKIPGGFLRREGRPSEHATLTARLIDRPIRPLFAEGFRNEVQVVNTVLSTDTDCSPEMAAMFGASLALCISNIPFDGPIAGVKVGYVDGQFVVNPTVEQLSRSLIDLTVAGTKEALNMVEAGAHEVSEDLMLDALMFGHDRVKELCEMQEGIIAKVGKEKMEVVLYEIDPRVKDYVNENGKARLEAAVSIHDKLESYAAQENITNEMKEHFANDETLSEKEADKLAKQTNEYCTEIIANEVRRLISDEKIRPDGRALDEIRPLDSQVDLLPRVHGSALFTRGQTQVLSVTTLGPLGDNQIVDDLTDIEEKRFMHQYNFPPYCVGEVGRMGSPGRREIGHGALGERALLQVLPSEEDFPYAIRTVAEVLESNGSSSQASICAGSMSLMAAGVPIKAPVAGVAMGLITTGDNYSILTDIQGMEDHYGDMDFKVAGTRDGITALQMDIKCKGITREIFKEALAQAHKGRMEILDNMATAIEKPREEVSEYAPKMVTFMIPSDKIREVIGTGGKTINEIIEKCDDVKIDIDDDGKVVIYHTSKEAIQKAKDMIDEITREAKIGEIYDAKVVRMEKFGCFVELFKGQDALLHVSKIKHERVNKPEDVLKLGDIIKVKVMEIDEKGRVNVSAKELLPKPEKKAKEDRAPKQENPETEEVKEEKHVGEVRFFGKK
ncbi:MAG: polyribonucleotide nucleotidyltransferase [Erysipelotrichaceae bacterium]|nr:polyribonucleotide nucleotidyltransferase [Erysipelotrichaceae bacterium]